MSYSVIEKSLNVTIGSAKFHLKFLHPKSSANSHKDFFIHKFLHITRMTESVLIFLSFIAYLKFLLFHLTHLYHQLMERDKIMTVQPSLSTPQF